MMLIISKNSFLQFFDVVVTSWHPQKSGLVSAPPSTLNPEKKKRKKFRPKRKDCRRQMSGGRKKKFRPKERRWEELHTTP